MLTADEFVSSHHLLTEQCVVIVGGSLMFENPP